MDNLDINLKQGDCLELIKGINCNSVDLVIIDPPYEFNFGGGGGTFGSKKRKHHKEYNSLYYETQRKDETFLDKRKREQRNELRFISKGFDFKILDELIRVMKKINIYIWCSKLQVSKILKYFEDKGCNIDILTWHKTNPTPTMNNTYANDTEYLIFAREKGVKVYGNYHTKRKYYVTPTNVKDKKLYKHPTIKPLEIIKNLVINSSKENEIVLDCFMGSGTTGVACKELNRYFIGIELNEEYFNIAKERITSTLNNKECVF